MRYYVVAPDGKLYGPADVATLSEWAREGRVHSNTLLQDEMTSERLPASSIPALGLAPSAPPQNYTAPPQNPHADYYRAGPQVKTDDGTRDVVTSYICAALSIICCPLLAAGFTSGFRAKRKGHPGAQGALIVNTILLCVLAVLLMVRVATRLQ